MMMEEQHEMDEKQEKAEEESKETGRGKSKRWNEIEVEEWRKGKKQQEEEKMEDESLSHPEREKAG